MNKIEKSSSHKQHDDEQEHLSTVYEYILIIKNISRSREAIKFIICERDAEARAQQSSRLISKIESEQTSLVAHVLGAAMIATG